MTQAQSSRDMQQRRDALVDFEQKRAQLGGCHRRAPGAEPWLPPTATARVRMELSTSS